MTRASGALVGLRALALLCVLANTATAAEVTTIPTVAPTGSPPIVGAACTEDADCAASEFCDCGTEATTQPGVAAGDGSPAAPLARTPLASALSFVGVMLAAWQSAAADVCSCKMGARWRRPAADPTVQPAVNATGAGADGSFGGAYSTVCICDKTGGR